MKRTNLIWFTVICALLAVIGTGRWLSVRPVHAQQNEQDYEDGTFYISAYIDVDDSYNLYAESDMQVEFDFDEDIDEIEVDGVADQDGDVIGDGYSDGDDYATAEVSLQSNGPVATGHEYGMGSDGYACFFEGYNESEGFDDCEWEYVSGAYAAVNVQNPPPRIYGVDPPNAYQGDQGTLTLTGADFIENSTDQLTLNFSGSSNPFTLVSAPSTCTTDCTAKFSYDFTGYPAGTYTLSVTNNEATSDNEFFTVNPVPQNQILPPDPCDVTSNPRTGTTAIIPSGTSGGSGTIAISFSGAAFAAVTPSVAYGPFSTPNSIAANIAALITSNYYKYGLAAKAFGPYVVYSGNAALGTVSSSTSGPYTTDGSAAAAASAATACHSSQASQYYSVAYKAYIPVDNLPGPTYCSLMPLTGLDYLGDRSAFSATGYRLQETDVVGTNPSGMIPEQNPTPAVGKTVNFATTSAQYHLLGGPPLPTITRSQFLEPDPRSLAPDPGPSVYTWENACNPPYENAFGYATKSGMGGTASSSSANTVDTHFTGLASDPLERQVGGINWDLDVTIDTSSNTATINGWNTCYPAHQIRVNGVLVFDYQPPQNTTEYLAGCLILGDTGLLNRTLKFVSACTVKLDGSQAPCHSQ